MNKSLTITMELQDWPILKPLTSYFLKSVRMALVFGKSGNEALLLTRDDRMYGIGANHAGHLGLGDESPRTNLTEIPTLSGKGVKGFAYGGDASISKKHFVVAYLDNNELYHWGSIPYNQTPLLEPTLFHKLDYKVEEVACGNSHCVVLCQNGQVYTWGTNEKGQLGREVEKFGVNEREVNKKGIGNKDVAVKSYQVGRVEGILDGEVVIQISCGAQFTVAIINDGRVGLIVSINPTRRRFMGSESQFPAAGLLKVGSGILTAGSVVAPFFSVRCSLSSHSAFKVDYLDDERRLAGICISKQNRWHLVEAFSNCLKRGRGQLGHSENQTLDDYSNVYGTNKPCRVKGIIEEKTVIDISCGGLFSVVLLDNGRVVSWGNNVCGELGLGGEGDYETSWSSSSDSPTEVSTPNDVVIKKIVCGRSHTLALSKTGVLFVWGDNHQCQLGQSTDHRRCGNPLELKTNFRFTDIGACYASDSSVAQSEDKNVYMWGHVSPGKVVPEPTDSYCSSINYVFAFLTYPSMMIKPMRLGTLEPKPSAVLNTSVKDLSNGVNE